MRAVNMDPSGLTHSPGEIRTNCTTRFGAKHTITNEGCFRYISSVFIPYGSLIFACFQTTRTLELSLPTPAPIPMASVLPPYSTPMPSIQNSSPTAYGDVQSYLATPQTDQTDWDISPQEWHRSGTEMPKRPREEDYYETRAVYAKVDSSQGPIPHDPRVPFTMPVPVPTSLPSLPMTNPPRASRSPPTTGSRPLVRPPGDVSCCKACGTEVSPEWRKSEGGVKDLCNAYVWGSKQD
jgi:hypothetical protein